MPVPLTAAATVEELRVGAFGGLHMSVGGDDDSGEGCFRGVGVGVGEAEDDVGYPSGTVGWSCADRDGENGDGVLLLLRGGLAGDGVPASDVPSVAG